jgi:hypothetical protein
MKKVTMLGMFAVLVLCTTYGASEGQGPIRRLLFGVPANQTCVNGNCAAAYDGTFEQVPATKFVLAPSAKKAAELGTIRGTVIHEYVRHRLVAELMKTKGMSWGEARVAANSVSNEMLEAQAEKVGAPGGFFQQILAAFEAFINSPQGQQLFNALIQALIVMITHGIVP